MHASTQQSLTNTTTDDFASLIACTNIKGLRYLFAKAPDQLHPANGNTLSHQIFRLLTMKIEFFILYSKSNGLEGCAHFIIYEG